MPIIYNNHGTLYLCFLNFFLTVKKTQIQDKLQERGNLQAELDRINKARLELTELGTEKQKAFSTSISTLSGYWTYTSADAQIIKDWLEEGADDAVSNKI